MLEPKEEKEKEEEEVVGGSNTYIPLSQLKNANKVHLCLGVSFGAVLLFLFINAQFKLGYLLP
tara:strand:- start:356 stop:544 length:189 start_codon:yes stop_codon:yes gene_type:complete